jgi:hypothetical protein
MRESTELFNFYHHATLKILYHSNLLYQPHFTNHLLNYENYKQ